MNSQLNTERLLLRVPEVADCLSVSRALAYRWVRDGVLPTVRVGGSTRVPKDALLRWVQANTLNQPVAE